MRAWIEIAAIVGLGIGVLWAATKPEFDLSDDVSKDVAALCRPYIAVGTSCTPTILARQETRTGTTVVVILDVRRGDFSASPVVQLMYNSRGDLINTQ